MSCSCGSSSPTPAAGNSPEVARVILRRGRRGAGIYSDAPDDPGAGPQPGRSGFTLSSRPLPDPQSLSIRVRFMTSAVLEFVLAAAVIVVAGIFLTRAA